MRMTSNGQSASVRPAIARGRSDGAERRSVDFVPVSERHGSVRHLGAVWIVANINLTAMATGVTTLALGGPVLDVGRDRVRLAVRHAFHGAAFLAGAALGPSAAGSVPGAVRLLRRRDHGMGLRPRQLLQLQRRRRDPGGVKPAFSTGDSNRLGFPDRSTVRRHPGAVVATAGSTGSTVSWSVPLGLTIVVLTFAAVARSTIPAVCSSLALSNGMPSPPPSSSWRASSLAGRPTCPTTPATWPPAFPRARRSCGPTCRRRSRRSGDRPGLLARGGHARRHSHHGDRARWR